jgi:hypothetical protein
MPSKSDLDPLSPCQPGQGGGGGERRSDVQGGMGGSAALAGVSDPGAMCVRQLQLTSPVCVAPCLPLLFTSPPHVSQTPALHQAHQEVTPPFTTCRILDARSRPSARSAPRGPPRWLSGQGIAPCARAPSIRHRASASAAENAAALFPSAALLRTSSESCHR